MAELMTATAAEDGLTYSVIPTQPSYASDHACFAFSGVPAVLALTPGEHPYYHTPQDTIETILIDDLEASARLLWSWLGPMAMGTEDDYLGSNRGPSSFTPAPDGDLMSPLYRNH